MTDLYYSITNDIIIIKIMMETVKRNQREFEFLYNLILTNRVLINDKTIFLLVKYVFVLIHS
jgi:hypothetical protein